MTHVTAISNYQFSKIPPMGHHKDIGFQTDQEVKGCQASYMLSETVQFHFVGQFLFRNLLS